MEKWYEYRNLGLNWPCGKLIYWLCFCESHSRIHHILVSVSVFFSGPFITFYLATETNFHGVWTGKRPCREERAVEQQHPMETLPPYEVSLSPPATRSRRGPSDDLCSIASGQPATALWEWHTGLVWVETSSLRTWTHSLCTTWTLTRTPPPQGRSRSE